MPQPSKHFNPDPFAYHEEVELTIDDLTNLGVGVGRVDGWVVMVPFVIPGERVRVRIFANRKTFSEGDLVRVIDASPDRVGPKCQLYETCGGCQYQHMSYPAQLAHKRSHVADVMQRLGEIDHPVEAAHGSPVDYGYRSKLTPHWNRGARSGPIGDIGFLRYGSRRSLIDVPQCPIATHGINTTLPHARERVRHPKTAREKKVLKQKGGTLLLRDVAEGVVTEHEKVVTERVGEKVFQFKAGDFFQNNPFILPELVAYVASEAKTPHTRYLIDAYCGVGLFGSSLAGDFEQIAGVEASESAGLWAQGNARINFVENARFMVGAAEAIFEGLTFPSEVTAMIIDPPRKGCDVGFLEQLFAYGPARLVYVSCDPATQARDLKAMCAEGYRVERVKPFDLFPQTRHIENVVTLSRES